MPPEGCLRGVLGRSRVHQTVAYTEPLDGDIVGAAGRAERQIVTASKRQTHAALNQGVAPGLPSRAPGRTPN